MARLMVVDDEFFVRRGIIDSIQWADHDVTVCGEAASAEEALELTPTLKPDILLVDIRMGAMNGIELISHLSEQYPQLKFIILSGYGEFEYAQQAIAYGVSEYLLKPIGAEELVCAVLRVKKALDSHLRRQTAAEVFKHCDPLLSWNVPQKQLPLDSSCFRIVAFTIDLVVDKLRFGAAQCAEIRSSCQTCAEQYFSGTGLNHIVSLKHSALFFALLNYEQPIGDFAPVVVGLQRHLLRRCSLTVTAGYSREVFGYRNIAHAYNDAFAAIGGRLWHPAGTVIGYADTPQWLLRDYFYNPVVDELSPQEESLYRLLLRNEEEYPRECAKLWEFMLLRSLSEQNRLTAALRLLVFSTCMLNLWELPATNRHTLAHRFCSPDGLVDEALYSWYLATCRAVGDCMTSEKQSKYRSTVEIVIEYAKQHYGEPLPLSELAEMVHISPNYLCKIFKVAIGKNFKEWLTEYRIERSKELLLNPDNKMYEIAHQVGYAEYKHFAKLFKQQVGISASDFRVRRR